MFRAVLTKRVQWSVCMHGYKWSYVLRNKGKNWNWDSSVFLIISLLQNVLVIAIWDLLSCCGRSPGEVVLVHAGSLTYSEGLYCSTSCAKHGCESVLGGALGSPWWCTMVNSSYHLHSWGTLHGPLQCIERDGEEREGGRRRGEWLDRHNIGMLWGPLGKDTNYKKAQETRGEKRIINDKSQAVLAAVSRGWENATVIAPIQSPVCIQPHVCASMLVHEASLNTTDRTFLPPLLHPLPCARCRLAWGKARDEVLLSNLPADRHWWTCVEWL